MITLADIKAWAAGIAESQGTATPEEEAIAHRIRTEDARLRPLKSWECFRFDKGGPFPWMAVINGPRGFSFHADSATFVALAEVITAAAEAEARREEEWAALERREA